MFESGLCKLTSGDKTWANLTALQYHYFTQPPADTSSLVRATLPEWCQKFSCGAVFFIELLVPFLIFTPRPARVFAAFAHYFIAAVIILTGNYAFFNLLAIALCVLLIDDQIIAKLSPGLLSRAHCAIRQARWPALHRLSTWQSHSSSAYLVSVLSAANGACHCSGQLDPANRAILFFNGYGLFSVMTTSRLEIQIEGSNDRQNWRAYEFKYKPGELAKPLAFIAPDQPRLDWQMWFAAFSDWHTMPWFPNLITRILEGSPSVLELFKSNPFPDAPPRYVRAELYSYTFYQLR